MQTSSLPWWRTDPYTDGDHDLPVPQVFFNQAGPKGLALVRTWPDGRTDPGWGLQGAEGKDGFMPRYLRGEFNHRRVLFGFDKGRWAFAFVMRSVRMLCIDIDGKNGGLEHAKRLGMLPPTLAETSKSGDGYHLFYLVTEEWDDEKGYGLLNDRIGLEQGVDIRATGCVYHHPQQRWNHRQPVVLPGHLFQLLRQRDQKREADSKRITAVLDSNDTMEVLMMHDELLTELDKPIPQGKRNVTLFAIGSKMHEARVTDWEDHLERRAGQVGMSQDEVEKIIANIQKYAPAGAP
jgi:hypothetical protein